MNKIPSKLINLHTEFDKGKFTIYGCGKFSESSKHLSKTEAVLLVIELTKFLNQKK